MLPSPAAAGAATTRSTARGEWLRSPPTIGAIVGLVAGVAALGPAILTRGYVLSYDMVAVPRPPLGRAALGLDGSVPRAVPTDALVAVLSWVAPADLVQHVLLLAVFGIGGAGAARWMRTRAGGAAAAAVFVWNPYVLERLLIGHWAFVLGLAVLPWATWTAARLRAGAGATLWSLGLWIFAAGLGGSTALVVVAVPTLVVAAWPGAAVPGALRRAGVVVGVSLCAAAPWLLPSLALPGASRSAAAGVRAFASRADTPLGWFPSLVTLGGIWNPAVWPSERSNVLVALVGLLLVVAALALGGRAVLATGWGAGTALAVAGLGGLVVAGLARLPGGADLLGWAVGSVPGAGLLRDGQKFIAPLVLVVALCFGCAVERLLQGRTRAQLGALGSRVLAVTLVALPVLLLPSEAAGLGHRIDAVPFPQEWSEVQELLDEKPPGDVASFPWIYYRRFSWNQDRVVLDPLPRLLRQPVLANDDLPLRGMTVPGESARAARISAAVDSGADLADALRLEGVRYVVVHQPSAGAEEALARFGGYSVLHRGPELVVIDLGPAGPPRDRPPGWVAIGWLVFVGCGSVLAVGRVGHAFRAKGGAGLIASGRATRPGSD